MQTHGSESEIEAILSELVTAPCWAAKRGHGSFLTFDFGDRITRMTKKGPIEVGAIHLWVYMAKWALSADGLKADWETSWSQVDRVLQSFLGAAIATIRSRPTVIDFCGADSPRIALAPIEGSDESDPLFMLYLPGHRILCSTQSEQLQLGDDREPS